MLNDLLASYDGMALKHAEFNIIGGGKVEAKVLANGDINLTIEGKKYVLCEEHTEGLLKLVTELYESVQIMKERGNIVGQVAPSQALDEFKKEREQVAIAIQEIVDDLEKELLPSTKEFLNGLLESQREIMEELDESIEMLEQHSNA